MSSFTCPINYNHKLKDSRSLIFHLSTCKELLKYGPDKLFSCKFKLGHVFLNHLSLEKHEQICQLQQSPETKAIEEEILEIEADTIQKVRKSAGLSQISHYEYAIKKGLIQDKKLQKQEQVEEFQDIIHQQQQIRYEKDKKKLQSLLNEKLKCFQVQSYNKEIDNYILDIVIDDNHFKCIGMKPFLIQCLKDGLSSNSHLFKKFETMKLREQQSLLDIFQKKTDFTKTQIRFHRYLNLQQIQQVISLIQVHSYQEYLYQIGMELVIQNTDQIQQISQIIQYQHNIAWVSFDALEKKIPELLILFPTKDIILTGLMEYVCNLTHFYAVQISLKNQPNIFQYILQELQIMEELQWTDFKYFTTSESEELVYELPSQIINAQQAKELLTQEQQMKKLKNIQEEIKKEEQEIQALKEKIDKANLEKYQNNRTLNQIQEQVKQQNLELERQKQITNNLNQQLKQQRKQALIQIQNDLDASFRKKQEELVKKYEVDEFYQTKLMRYKRELEQSTKYLERKNKELESHQNRKQHLDQCLQQQNLRQTNSQQICTSCGEGKSRVINMPCAHLILCLYCYDIICKSGYSLCLECNQPVKEVIVVLFEDDSIILSMK